MLLGPAMCKHMHKGSRLAAIGCFSEFSYTEVKNSLENRSSRPREGREGALKGHNVVIPHAPVGQCTGSHDYPDSMSLYPVRGPTHHYRCRCIGPSV